MAFVCVMDQERTCDGCGFCRENRDEPVARCAACGEAIYEDDFLFDPQDGNGEVYCDVHECYSHWMDGHRMPASEWLPI